MKKRIIPVVLIDSGGKVVISRQFDPWRTVGMLMQSLKMHDQRGADELFILDILASKERRTISPRILRLVADNVRIPVTIGGGIKDVETAKNYINSGADKVCINSACINNKVLISEIASKLGEQAVVVNINYVWRDGHPVVFDYRTKLSLPFDLEEHIETLISAGVGELMLTSVDKDGSLDGFDQNMIKFLAGIDVDVPIIISGGGGEPLHFLDAYDHHVVSATASATIFVLTENTPQTLRYYCSRHGVKIRNE